jgi:hypothetical protein
MLFELITMVSVETSRSCFHGVYQAQTEGVRGGQTIHPGKRATDADGTRDIQDNRWLRRVDAEERRAVGHETIVALQGQLKQNAAPANNKAKKTPGKAAVCNSDNKFAWKLVAPKTGEPQEKTVEGKAYIYCPHHAATKWVLKINQEGIEHRTGCKMLVADQKIVAVVNVAASKTGKLVAAVANVMMHAQE